MHNLRLRTLKETELKLVQLQIELQFSSKASVMRLAIGLALNNPNLIEEIKDSVNLIRTAENFAGDYNRFTIYPQDELVYKLMMQQYLLKFISESDFFPLYTNAFITVGCDLLHRNLKMYKKDRVIEKMLKEGLN